MSVGALGAGTSLLVQSLGSMRTQLDDLQRQLGTGQKSTTYAGLGPDRGLTVGLQSQLSAISGYSDTANIVGVRINLQQAALTSISTLASTVKSASQTQFNIDATGQTATQRTASTQLDEVLGLLNTQAGDRYLFSGRATDQPATETLDHIMNGDVSRAGFTQVMAQRNQADLGANGLGRLVIPPIALAPASMTGASATLAPDAPATASGSLDLSVPYTSSGGTLAINGTNVTIAPGANITAILAAINAPGVVAATGVTATAPAGHLTLTSANADTAVDLTGSTGALINSLGVPVGPTAPTNLLTQGAATSGQTLTVTIGGNPPLTITFGTNQAAVPPEVSTLAELNSALGTLAGGTASVNPANGNISIAAANTTDAIAIGGTATAANFGLAAASATPNNVVSLAEDVAGSPFGFKISAISTTVPGAIVNGPTGSLSAVSVAFPQQPSAGQTVNYSLALPDGTNETLTLTATASATPGPGQFSIGATPAATLANFQTALNAGVSTLAATSLSAASAVAASNDFFDVDAGHPPMRVAGPPYDTATAQVAGTAANTVTWYTGDMGTDSARGTSVAKVDDSLSVAYGARANEQSITNVIKNIAVYAATTYSASDPNAAARYTAVNDRVGAGLAGTNGQQQIQDIEAELAFAQTTIQSATSRQTQRQNTLQDLLQGIETVPQDQVASQILALQTQLQASLQTTATLYKLSIVNYL